MPEEPPALLSPTELVIPVYVDTNALLDLLASIEDGFVMVEKVTSGQRETGSENRDAGGEFGIANVLNMLKIGWHGRRTRQSTTEIGNQSESERTHTYGSLLHRLRIALRDEALLCVPSTHEQARDLEFGDFVELKGITRSNPVTTGLRQVSSVWALFREFFDRPIAEPSSASAGRRQSGGRTTQSNADLVAARNQAQGQQAAASQADLIRNVFVLLDRMTAQLEREGTQTVVFECGEIGYQAVATLFTANLRDRFMSEILNREFRILGKVTRHLHDNDSEKVDLIAATGISGLSPQFLTSLSGTMHEMPNQFQVSEIVPFVDPPALEIIPIALYV